MINEIVAIEVEVAFIIIGGTQSSAAIQGNIVTGCGLHEQLERHLRRDID